MGLAAPFFSKEALKTVITSALAVGDQQAETDTLLSYLQSTDGSIHYIIHYINTRCYCILPVVNSWIVEKVKSIIYLQILSLIQMCDNSREGKIRLCSIVSKACMPQKKKKSHSERRDQAEAPPGRTQTSLHFSCSLQCPGKTSPWCVNLF